MTFQVVQTASNNFEVDWVGYGIWKVCSFFTGIIWDLVRDLSTESLSLSINLPHRVVE